jgi:hypothetical protein
MKNNFIALWCLFLVGCETVVDVNVPLEKPKITLNAMFSSDSVLTIRVNKSKYILDEGTFQPIENANVVIKENGVPYDVLGNFGNGIYASTARKKPAIGKTYEIEVSAPGMETVEAKSFQPEPANIKRVDFIQKEGRDNIQNYNLTVECTFEDNPDEANYYELTLFKESYYVNRITLDTFFYQSPVDSFTDDPAFKENSGGNIIFDDKLFNGKEIKVILKGSSYGFEQQETSFYLRVLSLSADLFKYKITSRLQKNSSGDPFAQPVHVYNNVGNGFGIFAGYAETEILLGK